jgi:hypothetical protein
MESSLVIALGDFGAQSWEVVMSKEWKEKFGKW